MGKDDDFNAVLAENSTTINLVTATKTISGGIVQRSESTQSISAIVEPLTAKEIAFLPSAGYTTSDLKAYLSTSISVNIGDEIDYQGERYIISEIEKNAAYIKLLLKKKLN